MATTSLIDTTAFERELFIPDKEKGPTRDTLCAFIKEQEPKILTPALGYGFYKAMLTGLALGTVPQRWTDLLNGADWQDENGRLWPGGSIKRALACFTYYHWQVWKRTLSTPSGEKRATAENTDGDSANRKAAVAWNEGGELLDKMYHYLARAQDGNGDALFPEFLPAECRPFLFNRINTFQI